MDSHKRNMKPRMQIVKFSVIVRLQIYFVWLVYLPICSICLPYKVKMQYVQISNIIDTSIKRTISGQPSPMVKGYNDVSYGRYGL